MKPRKLLVSLFTALSLIAVPLIVSGDDTDLYVDNTSALQTSSLPLVMISLDYRSNLTQEASVDSENFFRAAPYNLNAEVDELKAIGGGKWTTLDVIFLSLKVVLDRISGVKIGLMVNHRDFGQPAFNASSSRGYQGETPVPNRSYSDGGSILMGFKPIDAAGSRALFEAKVKALKRLKPDDRSPDHPYQGSELFYEFFRYLTGQKVYNGHNGWIDYEGTGAFPADNKTNMRCENTYGTDANLNPGCWDPTIETPNPVPLSTGSNDPPSYLTPFAAADACAKVFTINLLFGNSQNEADPTMFTRTQATGGLGIPAPATQGDYFTRVLSFLRDTDLGENPDLDLDTTGDTFGTVPELAGKQNVTSYFVVPPAQINLTTTAYATAGGTVRPLPLADNPKEIVETLTSIFKQILSTSTTLVAASVPVNVFNRSEIVDNVYFALFQAQGGAVKVTPGAPVYWPGNLKKLRLDASSNPPQIRDSFGALAIDTDGRINNKAQSFWTDSSGALLDDGDINGDGVVDARDGVDSDVIADNTIPPPSAGTAANPVNIFKDFDGRHIPRGGAGQKIPGFANLSDDSPGDLNPATEAGPTGARKLYYLSSSGTASLQPLTSNSATPSAELKTQLGDAAMDPLLAQKILRYARGQDVDDEDGDCVNASVDPIPCRNEHRFWLLGDPLHSRPLPLNYGAITVGSETYSTSNPAIFIAMASNDGYLRMFRNTTGSGAQSGQEVWAFMPPEGMAIQRQLMDVDANKVPVHPYSFDGEPTALVIDVDGDGSVNGSDRVLLFIGLRRGGSGTSSASISSSFYALDVTNPLTPVFLWRLRPGFRTTAAGGDQATTDFDQLGFTFSRPRVGMVQDGVNKRAAVFFGGGYDGGYTGTQAGTPLKPVRFGKDVDGALVDDTKGKAIFVVRANNGALIWKAVGGSGTDSAKVFHHAGLKDGIASNLSILDTDADDVIDRILVGDTGGNLWRADLGPDTDTSPNGTTDDWKLTRLGCLGRHNGTGCMPVSSRIDDRRFFHEPDIIQARDAKGRYDAVVIGSGDREDPLDQGGDVDNYLYMIKDRAIGVGTAVDINRLPSDLTPVTNCANSSSGTCAVNDNGWQLLLETPNGEKALSAPVTISGSIFFTTYLPPPPAASTSSSCGPIEGNGFLYAIKLEDGKPARNYNTGDDGGDVNPDGSGTTKDDRQTTLNTPGIPAQVVYLGSPNQSGGACVVNILAGAQVFEAPGCPRFRTFWQRVGS